MRGQFSFSCLVTNTSKCFTPGYPIPCPGIIFCPSKQMLFFMKFLRWFALSCLSKDAENPKLDSYLESPPYAWYLEIYLATLLLPLLSLLTITSTFSIYWVLLIYQTKRFTYFIFILTLWVVVLSVNKKFGSYLNKVTEHSKRKSRHLKSGVMILELTLCYLIYNPYFERSKNNIHT